MISVRPVGEQDAAKLQDTMWEQQRIEVRASHGDELTAIQDSIRLSTEAYSFEEGDELLAIAGLVPFSWTQGGASPWLLTSVSIKRHPVTLVKSSKILTKHWLDEWGSLVNYIDSEYAQALAWAKIVGFTVGPPEPYGVSGKMFNKIVMEK